MIAHAETALTYPESPATRAAVRERSGSDRGAEDGTADHHSTGPGHAPRTTPGRAPRFPLGRVLATPGALHALAVAEANRGHGARRTGAESPASDSLVASLITRHVSGDWGQLDAEDREANEQALVYGARLLSAYELATGERVWIITEADRSATTILLPREY